MHIESSFLRTKPLFLAVITIVIGLALFTAAPRIAQAETRITDGYLANGAVWTASSSPYILEDSITVPSGRALTVEPGVTVEVDPAIDPDYLPEISVNGTLIMRGSPEKHITVKGLWGISVYHGTADISYSDISSASTGQPSNNGLYLMSAHVSVSSSTISGTYRGIYVESGELNVSGSRIEGNSYGIYVNKYVPIFMVMSHPLQVASTDINFGSLLAQSNPLPVAVVTISNSSLVGNSIAAIKNTETDPLGVVVAVNNWWGNASGPTVLSSNVDSSNTASYGAVSSANASSSATEGLVAYNPWLNYDPTRLQDKPKCCSSILFLPGIESSRLYRDEKGILGSGIGSGSSTNMLWEPNRNDDVRKLLLNTGGASIDEAVYSGSAIDSAWGYGVYGSFMKFLDGLVSGGNVNEWSAFGYDWRKPIAEVVAGPEKKATTTVSLIQTLTDMASRSKTGKVTLIAHSNGGLVAKYLTKTLADMGKDSLIDSIISVAVPYLGTPEAIGGILHGDDEELVGGWLLKQSVARQLGQNMASAYSLLPSAMYFSAAATMGISPVITFASTTPRNINNGSYQTDISSFSSQSAFMTDANNIRSAPRADDIESPIEGNKALMASAGSLHDILDLFSWPSHITRWAILGWDALTTRGISYRASKADPSLPAHDAIQTNMGDGTVVSRSASYDAGTTTNIDLQASGIKGTLHGNILESVTAQNAISGILEDSEAATKERKLMSIPGVTLGPLDYSKEKTYIEISTHSPIQPHVYDAQGNHTGEMPPPPGTEAGLWMGREMNIPGSSFSVQWKNNETEYDTYIYLPDNGQKYSVVMNGTGVGSFTFDVDRIRGGVTFDHAEYANLPVTPLTVATTTIQFTPTDIPTPPGVPFGVASSTFMATIQPLAIDVDGDGVTDIKAVQGSTTDPMTYWESIKKSCGAMFDSNCRGISNRIDHIEDLIKKGKFKKIHDFGAKIGQYMKHRIAKNLSDAEKQEVGDMLDTFISQFE